MLTAFKEAKRALVEAALVTHPHKGVPTALTTYASDEAAGAVLQQQIHGEWLHATGLFQKTAAPC